MKTIAKLRESDTGGRAEVKRIAILLSVVALMVGMMAMSVAPAFAAWDVANGACRTGSFLYYITGTGDPYLLKANRNHDDYVCYDISSSRVYDNRLVR